MSEGNGSRFIDRLVAASPTARRPFVILGETIYFRPLTREKLADAMPKDDVQRAPDYAGLFMLVACAETEDGQKVFRLADIETMRTRVSLELLQRIEAAMMGTLAPGAKEAEAELAANPPSTTG